MNYGIWSPMWQPGNVQTLVECKTVVFGRYRKARSAVSVILECKLAPDLSFEYGRTVAHRRSCSQKNTTVLQSKTLGFAVAGAARNSLRIFHGEGRKLLNINQFLITR